MQNDKEDLEISSLEDVYRVRFCYSIAEEAKQLFENNKENFQIAYEITADNTKILFTHAGVTENWLKVIHNEIPCMPWRSRTLGDYSPDLVLPVEPNAESLNNLLTTEEGLIAIFLVSVCIILVSAFKIEDSMKFVRKVGTQFFIPLMLFFVTTVAFSWVISLFMGVGNNDVTQTEGLSISMGDPVVTMMVMIALDLLLLFIYWKIIKQALQSIKHPS